MRHWQCLLVYTLFILYAMPTRSQYIFKRYYIPPQSNAPTCFMPYNNKLYFFAVDSTKGLQLWHFENDETFYDFDLNYSGKSYANSMAVLNSKLYLTADRGLGTEIYSYDGIHEPVLVKDIAPGYESSEPVHLNIFNSKLFFIAHDNFDDLHGHQIWSHDPATNITKQETFEACDYTVNSSCNFEELTLFNNELFFRAGINNGYQLYSYDPEISKISLISDTIFPNNSEYPSGLSVLNDELFFSANTIQYGTELYVYDGAGVPKRISDLLPGKRSGVLYNLHPDFKKQDKCFFKDRIYFIGVDTQSVLNTMLCGYNILNGTSAPVLSASGGPQHLSILTELAVYNNTLFFSASDSFNINDELWQYDGINPPALVKDINHGSEGSYPSYFKVWNNSLFFTAYSKAKGVELYKMTDTSIKTSFNQHFALYPNPSKNICYLDVSLNAPDSFAILLDDILGRQVYYSGRLNFMNGTVTIPIDVATLSSSVYMLRIVDEKGKVVYTAKMVKE